MWCQLSNGISLIRSLRSVVSILILTTLVAVVSLATVTNAAPSTNKTVNFQGRLSTAAGAVVADGYYNIQFKIYQDGTGAAAGNPGGSLRWTESYVNSGDTSGVQVKNGFFSVDLGTATPFGSSVDWDQDTLFLSMNVAGNNAACSTFGTAPCIADGEMLPMKRITATPYAINAGAVNGKTADNFIQLAQGVQTDASTNTSSIHLNKTGTGNLIQLQNSGSDVFNITNTGDIEFGSSSNHAIAIGSAATNTAGKDLSVLAGQGGSGAGSIGGTLFLQGGNAGGSNGDGGNVAINGGSGTGTGKSGSVYIGATNTSTVQIGDDSLASGTQTLTMGTSSGAGTTNVTIGSTGTAGGGSTTIQSKDDTTIATNGEQRARFSGSGNTLYVGNADSSGNATTANGFTIQGTSSTGANAQGGSLNLQAGAATNGNANGGNLTLSGGAGSGTGAAGLVVINTPTFQAASTDANCYTGGALVANSCTFTSASVNSSSVLVAGFSADSRTATLPDPSITTAGRIMYVTAANGSKTFSLRLNVGGGTGVEQSISLQQNTTATLVWNGSDWTNASGGSSGGSSSASLQDAYNSTAQAAGSADLIVGNGAGGGGFTVRESSADPLTTSKILDVQGSSANSLFSINSNINEAASNPGAETAGGSATAFPTNTWKAVNTTTISRNTSTAATGQASVQVDATGEYDGVENRLRTALTPNTRYNVSFSVKLQTGTFTDMGVYYSPDASPDNFVECSDNIISVPTGRWEKITCSFVTPASGILAQNVIGIDQAAASTRTFYIDNLSVTPTGPSASPDSGPAAAPNVQIGGGGTGGATTLFTLDKSSTRPSGANHESLLGSMYYDESLGKVQCYEAEGWQLCGDSPDTYISLSPEYSNAVVHGTGTGTLTTGLCSDMLNINDSSTQTTICGLNETYNFYKWTTTETTSQTRSIFVTQQLPANFKSFVAESASLMARTDNSNSAVNYQIYRNNSNGLTACGTETSASTGTKTTWQKAPITINSGTCNFTAGENVVIRINMTSKSNANAYVSNLNFTYSTK